MKDSIARRGKSSSAFALLSPFPPVNVYVEWPGELPEAVVIDSPVEWAVLFLVAWLVVRLIRRE